MYFIINNYAVLVDVFSTVGSAPARSETLKKCDTNVKSSILRVSVFTKRVATDTLSLIP